MRHLRTGGALVVLILWVAAVDGLGNMYTTLEPMSIDDALETVCWKEKISAGYVTGKTFELLLGPAVLHGEIDQSIPHLKDTLGSKTYKEVGGVFHELLCPSASLSDCCPFPPNP